MNLFAYVTVEIHFLLESEISFKSLFSSSVEVPMSYATEKGGVLLTNNLILDDKLLDKLLT